MKRRHFIKSTLITGTALSISPRFAFSQNTNLPYNELIGKGNPTFFGDGNYRIRKEAYDAFIAMQKEALKSGIHIKIVSSYRSYDHQKRIWERKYKKNRNSGLSPIQSIKKIIEYSTIPGTSRHHWGTDIDIVDGNFINTPNLLSEHNFKKGQPFYKLNLWLKEHANSFGFYIVYTKNSERKGFKHEPWHYSYEPLSCQYLKAYRKLDILNILQKEKFAGSEHFTNEFMNSYIKENILDINPELLS